tara:strand:- start:909 stop:1082 length:174 start_codon:yes stop_codon:yes gene_type:complete
METGNKITTGETMRENLKIITMMVCAFSFLFLVLSNADNNKAEDQIKYYNIKTQLNK